VGLTGTAVGLTDVAPGTVEEPTKEEVERVRDAF